MNSIDRISYSENISWTLFDDEVFVFNEITNEIFLLKGIMKDFWLLLSMTENFDEINIMLAKKYGEDIVDISVKMIQKIRKMLNKNLIVMEGIL